MKTQFEQRTYLKHFLHSALGVAEWLQNEYAASNPDAICFMEEWLTLKADYAAARPELGLSDAPLDDFSFIPLLREALAALEQIDTRADSKAGRPLDDEANYQAFLDGQRTYITRFAKWIIAEYNAGSYKAIRFVDDLIGMNDGLSCFIEDFDPNNTDAYRQIVVMFMGDISSYFGYPFLDEVAP